MMMKDNNKFMLFLLTLLGISSSSIVDARCMPSPEISELLVSQSYAVRVQIIGPNDNFDVSKCTGALRPHNSHVPVIGKVIEIFKKNETIVSGLPALCDEIQILKMTDTGLMQFVQYTDTDLNYDPDGYLLFPSPSAACSGGGDDTSLTPPLMMINECQSSGIKFWSAIDNTTQELLRGQTGYEGPCSTGIEEADSAKTEEATTTTNGDSADADPTAATGGDSSATTTIVSSLITIVVPTMLIFFV